MEHHCKAAALPGSRSSSPSLKDNGHAVLKRRYGSPRAAYMRHPAHRRNSDRLPHCSLPPRSVPLHTAGGRSTPSRRSRANSKPSLLVQLGFVLWWRDGCGHLGSRVSSNGAASLSSVINGRHSPPPHPDPPCPSRVCSRTRSFPSFLSASFPLASLSAAVLRVLAFDCVLLHRSSSPSCPRTCARLL